jgi:hypothetical protein
MMLKREGLTMFVEAKKLKATLIEEGRQYPPHMGMFTTIIKEIDHLLTLEEKVKNMKRATVTRRIELEMLEIMGSIVRGMAAIEMTTDQKMTDQLAITVEQCGTAVTA